MGRRWGLARKVDAGQQAIIDALRRIGCTVEYIQGRAGLPDLVVGLGGHNFLLEVKAVAGPRGGLSEKGQKKNAAQEAWHAHWRGHVATVRTPEEACALVSVLSRGAA
jgi:hypothetical protein